ncbi:MAG: FkbM family methyltransferase [Alphaproteobacteria bacterium]|nr:FkbM family methyltransferase [Alphaproteobacteria bacterium]
MNLLFGRVHEADFEAFAALPQGAVFIDIGANMGQSAVSVRAVHKTARIHSFEPNPHLEPALQRIARSVGTMDIEIVALGDSEGEATLSVPVASSGTEFS